MSQGPKVKKKTRRDVIGAAVTINSDFYLKVIIPLRTMPPCFANL